MARQRTLVVGGGIAGMTTATLLAERGHDVVLCERSASLGGKAKSERTADGHPIEHSLRIFNRYYPHLLAILDRIPTQGGGRVTDHFVEIDKAMLLDTMPSRQGRLPRPIGKPWGPLRRAIVRTAWPVLMPLNLAVRFLAVALVFRRRGIPLLESADYLLKHLGVCFMCEERLLNELSAVSYETYMGLATKTPIARHVFEHFPLILTAARPNAEARSVVFTMMRALFGIQLAEVGYEHYPTLMMLDGPTSERIVAPWERHLADLGVEVRLDSAVADMTFEGDQANGVTLADGTCLAADAVVLALPYIGLKRLAKDTALGERAPTLVKNDSIQLEWSNGVQLFLDDVPAEAMAALTPGVLCLYFESAWAWATVLQGEGLWRGVPLPTGTRYVLSATWSNAYAPGPVHGKPVPQCHPKEFLDELLAQCDLQALRGHILGWQNDRELAHVAADAPSDDRPHATLPAYEGHNLLNRSPLAIPLPSPSKAWFHTRTEVPNVFLAGEFVQTKTGVPTMQKASEAGYLAAQAVVELLEPARAADVPSFEYSLPFAWLRRLDAWIYRRSRTLESRVPQAGQPDATPAGDPREIGPRV